MLSQQKTNKVYGHCDTLIEVDAADPEGILLGADGKVFAFGKKRKVHVQRSLTDLQLIARQRQITCRAARQARARSGTGGSTVGVAAKAEATAAAEVMINPVPAKVRDIGLLLSSTLSTRKHHIIIYVFVAAARSEARQVVLVPHQFWN